ncbi:amino acid adenylation domain-containing protein [Aquimarina sp. TRL1]|uniref:non-ribosomal peptide synthetase n=1 Tax=Aquimarina sp. (strain TRL1) TaxID=2736252 RepID=UPI00158A8CAA|nr:non-ribosomal peptide synthetase [Aquimarina sp. TRL1]QKX03873.1 amino acid adenylation domain-containing protein [Aquimarina sp. TRL1]
MMTPATILSVLTQSTSSDRPKLLTDHIRRLLVDFLELDAIEEVSENQVFVELGVTSMEALQFKTTLEDDLQCQLRTTLFFDYPEMQLLVSYLLEEVLEMEGGSMEGVINERHETKKITEEKLVVVGMAGIFPDEVDVAAMWEKSMSETVRQKEATYNSGLEYRNITKIDTQRIREVLGFEEEIKELSRQQTILYSVLAKAMKTYGFSLQDWTSQKTGVFIAADTNVAEKQKTAYQIPLANEVSYRLNIVGPSETINTFCTSVYVALHKAVRCIREGECEQAIVGGVNLIEKKTFEKESSQGMYEELLSATNCTKSYSNTANGFLRSEGAGVLIVTKESIAIANERRILASLCGTSVVHGGKNFSIEAPNAKGIKEAIWQGVKKAGIPVDTIDYIEAHGIGNRLADAVELSAISEAYKKLSTTVDKKWYVSSVKPIIGHPEIAAGMASLLKVIKALEFKVIPGISNLEEVNTEVPSNHSLILERFPKKWKKGKTARRAALSSYAIGGVNAHCIIEEYTGSIETEMVDTPEKESVFPQKQASQLLPDTSTKFDKEKEILVYGIIEDVFGVGKETIVLSKSPVDYGFDSIKITQFIRRVNEQLHLDIKMGQMLGMENFQAFFDLLSRTDYSEFVGSREVPKVESIDRLQRTSEASVFQKGIFLIHELDAMNTAYNLPIIFSVKQRLNPLTIIQTLGYMLEEYPVLRMYFDKEETTGEIMYRLHALASCLQLDIDEEVRLSRDDERLKELIRTPFVLTQDCLLRTYIRGSVEEGAYYLIFIVHHTILDGMSGGVFMTSFWNIYNRLTNEGHYEVQQPEYTFFDFIESEKNYLLQQGKADGDWWKEKMEGVTPMTLPYDRWENKEKEQRAVGVEKWILEDALFSKLQMVAKELHVNTSVLLLGVFNLLVYRLTNQEDIVMSMPVQGRTKMVYEKAMGCFINVILLRNQVSSTDSFITFVQRIKKSFYEGMDRAQYPLVSLLSDLRPVLGSVGANETVVPVSYTYQNIFDEIHQNEAFSAFVTPVFEMYQETEDEYALEVYDFRKSLQVHLKYKEGLFEATTIKRHLRYFEELLRAVLVSPEKQCRQYTMLPEKEIHQQLYTYNDTAVFYEKEYGVPQLFERIAARHPEAIALLHDHEKITYRSLEERSRKVALFLQEKGVVAETLVAICMNRSIDAIVSVLGILRAGGAYLPIDISISSKRRDAILENSHARGMIVHKEKEKEYHAHNTSVWSFEDCEQFSGKEVLQRRKTTLSDLAYVIYTSGSTGTPKGVMIEQQSLLNLCEVMKQRYAISKDDRILQFASLSFDMSVEELFPFLLSGATVVLRNEADILAERFYNLVMDQGVTILNLPPLYYNVIKELSQKQREKLFDQVRIIAFGGEELPEQVLSGVQQYPVAVFNAYGPTEYTVNAAIAEVTYRNKVTLGTPVNNTRFYVLGETMELLPEGVVGELHIAGDGIARGYLNNPVLTAEKFVKNPFGPKLLYKTGDAVKWLPDGTLEYHGRIDHQVKIRGYRVELGEVESVLEKYPGIDKASVVLKKTEKREQLIAFYKAETPLDHQLLKKHMQDLLPEYMIPVAYEQLEKIPVTPNGKIDRKALENKDITFKETPKYTPPQGEKEEKIVHIWQELLEEKKIGVTDDFFEIGGHSLLAIKAVARINTILEEREKIEVKTMFNYSTIRTLCKYITAGEKKEVPISLSKEMELPVIALPEDLSIKEIPETILLTGGTGFVGVFILKELLESHQARILCLVRAESSEKGREKIKEGMLRYEIWEEHYSSRIEILLGDIGRPLLGLTNDTFESLSKEVDIIYHNAAYMNHLETYDEMKAANVGGTIEVIKLAAKNRMKPIHYTSTLGVFNNEIYNEIKVVDEHQSSEKETHYASGGYAASKWVAENVIVAARKQGIPCNIYRLGLITGESEKGILDKKQWFYGFLESLLLMKKMFAKEEQLELMILPVDKAAKALVYLSTRKRNQTYHISGDRMPLYTFASLYNKWNAQELEEVSLFQWLQSAKAFMKEKEGLQLPPFMYDYLPLGEEVLKERVNKELKAKLVYKTLYTQEELSKIALSFSVINEATILSYFEYVKKQLEKKEAIAV